MRGVGRDVSRVRGWRGALRVRCVNSTRFRGGAQSGSHRSVSTPCPSEPDVRISRIRLSSGIMPLARGNAGSGSHSRCRWLAFLRLPEAARLHPRGVPRRRATGPVHAPAAPSLHFGPAPSLAHVMLRNSPPLHAGFVGKATPAGLRPSVIPPHLRPLSSTGITPRLQYYGPLRHPVGPACPSRGPGCRVHGTDRASRVATLSIFHACRRHYPGGNRPVPSSLSSRPTDGLPLLTGGSASALCVSRPARRSLAFRPAWSLSRPRRPVSPKCFSPCPLPP